MYACRVIAFLYLRYKERCGRVGQRPSEFLAFEVAFMQYTEHYVIVFRIDEGLAVGEKQEFLTAFIFKRMEILLMCLSESGENAYGRLYDVSEFLHLIRLTYASFDNT